jgi:hypothetical protein
MEVTPLEHIEAVQEPVLKLIHIVGSLGDTLTWGEQQIPEPMDKVTDIQVISYDEKRKSIMKRTTKKRRLTIDILIIIMTEENILSTKHAKTFELIDVRMAIIDAKLDREIRDEQELAIALKEFEHLHHLEKYYQDYTQDTVLLRSKFQYAYAKFTNERHIFIVGIYEFQ